MLKQIQQDDSDIFKILIAQRYK